jgi:ribonucleoside-diphosphate reductase alpha chain
MEFSSMESLSPFANTIFQNKYAHDVNGRKEEWHETAERVARCVVTPYMPELTTRIQRLITERKFMPGGRYLYAAGRKFPQVNNCFLFRAEDTREGWGELLQKCTNALMTGGGIGVVYSNLRPEGSAVGGMGGKSTGPLALMKMVNECGRYIVQGGSRRSAIWAGLHWNHPDALKFIAAKNWSSLVREGKRQDFSFPAPLDVTNLSLIQDDEFFAAFGDAMHRQHSTARVVYAAAVRGMVETSEPGFSVDVGDNEGEHLRNACTEVTSRDDGDMCNLGSLNLARFRSIAEFTEAVELGTAFLLCGTIYSKLPLAAMYQIRERNRRLGLGLMGIHEWLLCRGYRYAPCSELAEWLRAYAMSGAFANRLADRLSISRPVATRAVAPTGTISIIAETTSGVEPIFATAFKRRYLDGSTWKAQYVVDAAAQRLITSGVDPDSIEDAMSLSCDQQSVDRRIGFQKWLQTHVDHGISSTINLPAWGSAANSDDTVDNFAANLLTHLPHLRGITAYPDGCRDGQPLVRVPYQLAVNQVGVEFVDQSEAGCKSGVCGI